MQKLNEFVYNIRCVGGTFKESDIVTKVLKSLPASYKHKVAAIEIQTMTIVTRYMLIGKLLAFELSEFHEYLPKIQSHSRLLFMRRVRKDMV